MKNNRWIRTMLVYGILIVVVLSMAYVYMADQEANEIKEVEFSEFVSELKDQNVKSLTLEETSMKGTLKDKSVIHCYAPSSIQLMTVNEQYIMPQVEAGKLEVVSVKPKTTPWYISILPYLLTIVVFVGVWIFFMNSSQGGAGRAMSFGRSRAKMYKDDGKKVTFKDVAGLKEEKEELQEIVEFLRYPDKYTHLGARIPKGVLLVGPPGTGKTYVTKAVSGEAGVPFYSISGSDFVEMFVGVGASRVRDLFDQAKKNAPSIIFIDEIDAVGRRRGSGVGGGHDEREQTLNQMLVEMDGFGMNEGVIVFAATNRPDVLDPALLRPGRFDRQIVIGLPDVQGREEIFHVHAENKPLDESVKIDVLAKMTPGFSPADIENVLNEAALLTARHAGATITMDDIEEAITKVMAGPAKKSRKVTEAERRLTAYHEAGHAVLIRNLPDSDPVHQVTIVPRGMAGGMTMFLPTEDRSFESKKRMESSLVHLLGGRVAEALVLNDISTGASNDIERATQIARNMVTKYGMSETVGTVNYSDSDEVFIGRDFTSKKAFSEETASLIDREVKRLIDTAYAKAEELLRDHMDKLELVAETLLEIETLNAEDFEALYTGAKSREEIVASIRREESRKEQRIATQKAEEARREAERKEQGARELLRQRTLRENMEQLTAEEVLFGKTPKDNRRKNPAGSAGNTGYGRNADGDAVPPEHRNISEPAADRAAENRASAGESIRERHRLKRAGDLPDAETLDAGQPVQTAPETQSRESVEPVVAREPAADASMENAVKATRKDSVVSEHPATGADPTEIRTQAAPEYPTTNETPATGQNVRVSGSQTDSENLNGDPASAENVDRPVVRKRADGGYLPDSEKPVAESATTEDRTQAVDRETSPAPGSTAKQRPGRTATSIRTQSSQETLQFRRPEKTDRRK